MDSEAVDATDAVTSGEESTEKLFSQEDVDRLITERLARERKKYEKSVQDTIEQTRLTSLSESEQLVEKAKNDARAEVKRETAEMLAAAELKAALTGLVTDPDSVIEDLNLSRFVTSDYDVDKELVKITANKYKALTKGNVKTSIQPGRSTATKTGSAKDDFVDFLGSFN